jgi:formylmethanofuran dehydrogenase subunit B
MSQRRNQPNGRVDATCARQLFCEPERAFYRRKSRREQKEDMSAWVSGKGTGQPGPANHFENVACPFCGILCDDLEIGQDEKSVKVLKNGCPRAIAGFERLVADAKPQVKGNSVELPVAIETVTRLIKNARFPLFGGLSTDVEGMRAVTSIAEKAGGVIDHALSEAQYRNFRVLQTSGWVMSTLTEARNRADLFIIAGSDIHKVNPRFFERIICPEVTMFDELPKQRTIVFLGKDPDTSALTGPRIGDIVTLPCEANQVGEVLSALRAYLKGASLPETVGGLKAEDIVDLADRCRKASYGVVVWNPAAFNFPNADLTVAQISEFIKDMNPTQRFAGLSIGGNEGSVTASAVSAWQNGFPLRVSYATGKPEYDDLRYSTQELIANNETDLIVWIASLTPDLAPPVTNIPTVILGTPGIATTHTPEVYIPIGTPGVDHSGRMIRVDSVVSLPLRDLKRSSLPRLADILAAVEAAL